MLLGFADAVFRACQCSWRADRRYAARSGRCLWPPRLGMGVHRHGNSSGRHGICDVLLSISTIVRKTAAFSRPKRKPGCMIRWRRKTAAWARPITAIRWRRCDRRSRPGLERSRPLGYLRQPHPRSYRRHRRAPFRARPERQTPHGRARWWWQFQLRPDSYTPSSPLNARH